MYRRIRKIKEIIMNGLYLSDNRILPFRSSIILRVLPHPGHRYPVKTLNKQEMYAVNIFFI